MTEDVGHERSVASRFTRSVNLQQDLWQPDSLQGYLVTAARAAPPAPRCAGPLRTRGGPRMDADRPVRHREIGPGALRGQAPGQ